MPLPESESYYKDASTHKRKALKGSFREQINRSQIPKTKEIDWRQSYAVETDSGLPSVSPGKNAFRFKVKEWKSWLKEYIGGFEDNPNAEYGSKLENAAIMMESFTKGIDYMHSEHVARGNTEFKKPPPYVILSGESPDTAYWRKQKIITIRKDFLLRISSKGHMDVEKNIVDLKFGKKIFIGTYRQWLTCYGIEECDHAEYRQFHDSISWPKGFWDCKPGEYDAQTHEFRALLEKKIWAKKNGFLPAQIAVLDNKIKMAKKYSMLHNLKYRKLHNPL